MQRRLLGLTVVALIGVVVAVGGVAVGSSQGHFGDQLAQSETPEGNHDTLSALRTHWQGQLLEVTAGPNESETVFQIRTYEDGEFGSLVTEFVLDEDATTRIDTTRLAPGSYVILDDQKEPREPIDGNLTSAEQIEDAWWEIAAQDLAINAEEHSLGEPVEVSVTSNRGRYPLVVSGQGLTAAELSRIFPDDVIAERQGNESIVLHGQSSMSMTLDLTAVDPGEYTFDFEVQDTGITADLSITRTEPEEVANLESEVIQSTHGAIPTVQVNLQDTDAAKIAVRSTDGQYRTTFTAVDGDGDGVVQFRMNTYLAGWVADESRVFTTVNDADAIRQINRAGAADGDGLAPGDYEITVAVGGEELDLATLVLSPLEIATVELRSAPEADMALDPTTIRRQSAPAGTVALGDAAVIHVEANGFEGLLEGGYDLAPTSGPAEEHGVYVSLAAQGTTGLEDPDLSAGNVVGDGEGGLYFIMPVKEGADGFLSGTTYAATFTMEQRNPLVTENIEITRNLSVTERVARFNNMENGIVILKEATGFQSGDIKVNGNTTVAPRSELVVVLRSEEPLVVRDQTVTVTARGEWEAEFEIPDDAENFTVQVREGADTISDIVPARLESEDVGGINIDRDSTTDSDSDDGPSGGEEDAGREIHPAFVAIGAGLITAWLLLRFRDPIRARVRGDQEREGVVGAGAVEAEDEEGDASADSPWD